MSLAVISVLLTVLVPAFSMAQESARRVACASNVRQLGFATQMWAYDNLGKLPETVFATPGMHGEEGGPEQTVVLRLPSKPGFSSRWDGLGTLYKHEYVNACDCFYCPSHTGEHPKSRYADEFRNGMGRIVGNYQYRVLENRRMNTLDRLPSRMTLVADGLRSPTEYNHGVGNNMLKADLSVQWFDDESGRLSSLLALVDPSAAGENGGGGSVTAQVLHELWQLLDGDDEGEEASAAGP